MPPLHTVVAGNTGQGKSLYCAMISKKTLDENLKRFKKTGVKRQLWSNLKFADHVEKQYGDLIQYWGEPSGWKYDAEWIAKNLHDADLIWDEISEEHGADSHKETSRASKSFLRQYRKKGVRILSNTQDHADISIHARRRLHGVMYCKKLFGSRDISATLPPPKFIWGVVWVRSVLNPKETDPTALKFDPFPADLFFITREICELYDTRAIVGVSEYPPLKHILRVCEVCGKEHLKHE